MNGSLEVRRGNKVFSIIAAISFLFLVTYLLCNMISMIFDIGHIDHMDLKYFVYVFISSFLAMTANILFAVVCLVRRKNVFAIVVTAFPLASWILRMLLSFAMFGDGFALNIISVGYLLSLFSFIALAILCCIPKIADKCRWTRFIGAVPGVLYFLYLIIEIMMYRYSSFDMIFNILIVIPAHVLFGLWLASSEKKQKVAVAQQYGYAPAMQYGAPVQGYYPQYTDSNYVNAPEYQNAPEYRSAPQYSAEQYNGYNQGQN